MRRIFGLLVMVQGVLPLASCGGGGGPGFHHTCGSVSGGAVYCWGSGAAGQLGTNSTSQSDVPAQILGQP